MPVYRQSLLRQLNGMQPCSPFLLLRIRKCLLCDWCSFSPDALSDIMSTFISSIFRLGLLYSKKGVIAKPSGFMTQPFVVDFYLCTMVKENTHQIEAEYILSCTE